MTKRSDASAKLRALFLSPEAPYPAVGGGPLRSASILQYLAQRYSVHVIVFREPGSPDPRAAFPSKGAEALDVIDLPFHSKEMKDRITRNASRLIHNRPPLIDRFSGHDAQLAPLVSGQQYDFVVIEHFWCANYIDLLRPLTKWAILDLHNVESSWHRSMARSDGLVRRMAMNRFAHAALMEERRLFPKFDWILAASRKDVVAVEEQSHNVSVAVYPNALPEIPAPPRRERAEVVFSGNLEYEPNKGAVRFFRDRIWPDLRQRWPKLKWRIIGKNPHAVTGLVSGDPRIELMGPVDDAILSIAESQVAVVPVLAGSGTRVKILEAWASATPVVSTTLGAEGLDCKNGEHLLLADQPEAFVEAVSHLLASPDDRRKIGRNGRDLYQGKYVWPIAWKTLELIFGNACKDRPV